MKKILLLIFLLICSTSASALNKEEHQTFGQYVGTEYGDMSYIIFNGMDNEFSLVGELEKPLNKEDWYKITYKTIKEFIPSAGEEIEFNVLIKVESTSNTKGKEIQALGKYVGVEFGDMSYVIFNIEGKDVYLIGELENPLNKNDLYKITYIESKEFIPYAGEEVEIKELIKVTK